MLKKLSFLTIFIMYYGSCQAMLLPTAAVMEIASRIQLRLFPSLASNISQVTFPSITTISSQEPYSDNLVYTVNFMWINRSLNKGQYYVVPATFEYEMRKKLLTLLEWAAKTPQFRGKIVFWYDSVYTSTDAVNRTLELLNEERKSYPKTIAQIELRDIRTLNYVKQNPEAFSDKLPVYFRADLARIVATVETLETTSHTYFVYNDMDVIDVLTEEELFDDNTVHSLKDYGIVMRDYHGHFENQFHIVCKENQHILEALKFALIEVNIARGHKALEEKCNTYYLQQIVYCSFSTMFQYFRALKGDGVLFCGNSEEPYSKEKHGLSAFSMNSGWDNFQLRNKDTNEYICTSIPVKAINFPPPAGNYN